LSGSLQEEFGSTRPVGERANQEIKEVLFTDSHK